MTLAYEALRTAAIAITPIMPSKSQDLLDRLGVPSESRGWKDLDWKADGAVSRADKGVVKMMAAVPRKKGDVLFPDIKHTGPL